MTRKEKDNMLINYLREELEGSLQKIFDQKYKIKELEDLVSSLHEGEELLREEIDLMKQDQDKKIDEAYLKGWKQGATQTQR